jgi:DNA-binding winged helix-turn-helix (wHTH) protein
MTGEAVAVDGCPCELLRDGDPVEIHATPLRLLAYLVENRDRTVSKHELLDGVWPDAYVSENALTSALCEIRHALGDDGVRQRMIRTERGRGYRFVASVEVYEVARSVQAPEAIAVLPFIDLSLARDQECFADELTEELIYELRTSARSASSSAWARSSREAYVRAANACASPPR